MKLICLSPEWTGQGAFSKRPLLFVTPEPLISCAFIN